MNIANRARLVRCVVRIPARKAAISRIKGRARFADHSGERTVRIRKVESSILFVSTKKCREINGFTAFFIFSESKILTGAKLY